MSKKEKLINTLIDKHYNEAYDINIINESRNQVQVDVNNNILDKAVDVAAFESKMDGALEKMDLADNIDFSINIDTLKIIEQAAQIQTKRNSFKENVCFIITSILILSVVSVVFINIGIKFLIYFQVLLFFIMPWSLIPLSKHVLRRSENE
jgi:hypothetical protein